jgi:undecaprenyl diphosphate synthase
LADYLRPPDSTFQTVQSPPAIESTHDELAQDELKRRGAIPVHIAIIMDGNGRWAREKGRARVTGHREGVESVRDIAEASAQLGVKHLTLYTFSTENWQRPRKEVNALMSLLVRTTRHELKTLKRNGIRLNAIGDLEHLPPEAQQELTYAMAETADPGARMTLNLALSYSGRWEMARAARELATKVVNGELRVEDIDETAISRRLATATMPDPDLLVRTGGEFRISNFLLWQLAYTELYFTDCYWPEFRRTQLYDSIRDFQDRERRFGTIEEIG